MNLSQPPSDISGPADPRFDWQPEHALVADFSARSNLALTFVSLPAAKRADMHIFYTFCRLVDDIADSETLPPEEKTALLSAWRKAVAADDATSADSSKLVSQIHGLIAKYHVPTEYFQEIISGVEMDIHTRPYATFEQLRTYCYRVASVVGLVSIEIFGYHDPATMEYAVDLGLALQLTNIIRDVGVDLENGGRIYLPLEDMERFGYLPADLRARTYDQRFRALMEFECARAQGFYTSAVCHLSPGDRKSMIAAETMRAIYWKLLQKIRRERFRVFEQTYRLNKLQKMWTLLTTVLRIRAL